MNARVCPLVRSTVKTGEGEPCPRCLRLWLEDKIDREMVMPLDGRPAMDPLAFDGSGKCCQDCASADTLTRLCPGFRAARIAVGNDRREQLRMPGMPMGLVKSGHMRSNDPGDFALHLAWLEENVPRCPECWGPPDHPNTDGECPEGLDYL